MTIQKYSQTLSLPAGGQVELREMSKSDRDAVLTFARALPAQDLQFLRVDITRAAVVDDWVRNLKSGVSQSIVAYDQDGLVGYATVHCNPTSWTRHLGEIRVNVSVEYRSKGLGRLLIGRAFDLARASGLSKLTAHMTANQVSAQAAFRRLGFVPEALLADYVQDREGRTRDMVIMSFDIAGHSDTVSETLRV